MNDGDKPHAINNRVKVNVYEWDCDVAERTLQRKLEERGYKSGTVPGEFKMLGKSCHSHFLIYK